MKSPIKIGGCLFFATVAVMLAGCGSHDQSTTGTGGSQVGTPPSVIEQAKQNTKNMENQSAPNGQTAPAGH